MRPDYYSRNLRRFKNLNAPIKRNAPLNKVKDKSKSSTLTKVRKPYPRLLDASQRLKLQKEFSPYSALAAWYYESTAKVYAYLKANLNSRQTITSAVYEGKNAGISANKKKPELNYKDVLNNMTRTYTTPGRILQIRGDNVLLNMVPQTFTVCLGLNNEDAKNDLKRKLNKLFGAEFVFPTNYTTNESGERVLTSAEYTTGLKGVDFYSRLNFPIDPYPEMFQPKKIDINPIDSGDSDEDEDEDDEEDNKAAAKKLAKNSRNTGSNVKDVLKIVVKISEMDTFRNNGYDRDDLRNAGIELKFEVMGVCQFPLEYALWATHSTDITEFVPKLFREHFDGIGQKHLMPKGGTYSAALNSRTMHLGIIKQLNEDRIKEYGIEVRPRVNKENFTIRNNGGVLFVPDVDNTAFYVETLRNSYNSETGIVKQNAEIPELANKVILVDWINDQLAYTDNSGKPSTISLTGAIPLDDVTIHRYIHIPFIQKDDSTFLRELGSYGNYVCAQFSLYKPNFESSFIGLLDQVAYDAGTNSVSQMYDLATDNAENELNDKQKERFLEFVRLCGAIALKIMDCNRIAISTRMEYKIYFYAFGIYIKNISAFSKAYSDSIIKNSKPGAAELKTSFVVPNAPGIKMLLPHQQELGTIINRENPPEFMVVDIAAGGGKCSVGETIVTTDKGLLTLKELRNLSEKDNNKGFRTLNNISVVSSQGITEADATYSRMGNTTKIIFNDGSEFEGLGQHKLHNGFQFVKLSDLKIGDFFPKKIGLNVYGNINNLEVQSNRFTNVLTKPLARLIGYVVAEGYNSETRASVTITMHNPQIQKIILNDIKEVFEEDLEFITDSSGGQNVQFNSEISKYIQQLVHPATSARITVPKCIRQASKEMQVEFLRAIFEGDGCVYLENNGRWHLTYATISKKLAHQTKLMLENIGFPIKLVKKTAYYSKNGNASIGYKVTKRIPYELQVHYNDFIKFKNEINFVSTIKTKDLDKAIKHFKNQENTQNTNNQVFGIENTMPDPDIYRRVLIQFDNLLNKVSYQVPGKNGCPKTFSLTATNVFRNLATSHTAGQVNAHMRGVFTRRISKFNAKLLINIIDNVNNHDYISQRQANIIRTDKTLVDLIAQLKEQINTTWLEVTRKVKGKLRRVYDLSVPGPHDYVANGIMSHNTLQLVIDALTLKSKGKIKTAMIVCPGGLVKEWTTEINKMTKGEVNVVPITTSVIKKMRDHLGYDKLKFISYLKSAPVNTIFICSVNFLGLPKDHFDDKYVGGVMQYGETFVRFFPNVQILRQLNPDYIAIDEAHFIKNSNSRRTKSYFALSPVATYRRIASGTISADNPADMVPQYGTLNPAILGTKDNFIEKYGIGSNGKFVGLQTGMEKELDNIRRPYVTRVRKTRADWAFLLPEINTTLSPCYLSENQQKFYDFMFTDEMRKLRSDPKIVKLLEEADDSKAKAIEKLLETKLQVLEYFVNAPDTSQTFQKWADGFDIDENGEVLAVAGTPRAKLVPSDLVSPKVKKIDEVLSSHLQTSKNKVIIFGINKVVSRHIYTHSKYRNLMIHYSVSNSLSGMSKDEALAQFRNNAKYRIMCADAGSMRVGLNLQMADMVIYTQTEWSPGDQEQALSRAMRPDVGDSFKRDSISLIKLFANHTYETAKVAKLINKEVVNKQVDNSTDPHWNQFLEVRAIPQLEPIKMSIDFISRVKDIRSPEIANSIDWYVRINDWEIQQFKDSTDRLINYTAQRTGKDPTTIDLKKDAMLPVDSSSKIPGSKYIFTPLENGAIPIDRRNLNLSPIAIIKNAADSDTDTSEDDEADDDSDDAEIEENFAPKENDLVFTEYGYGYIKLVMKKQVKVLIKGFPRPPGSVITLSKLAVFKPLPPEDNHPTLSQNDWQKNVTKLQKDMKRAGDRGITFITNPDEAAIPVTETRTTPVKPNVPVKRPDLTPTPAPDTNEEDDNDTNSTDKNTNKDTLPTKKVDLDIVPIVINGVPALAAYTTEIGYKKLAKYGTWYPVPKFVSCHIRTFNGAVNMANAITNSGLKIPNGPKDPKTNKRAPDQLSRLQGLAKQLRGTTDNKLLVRNKGNYSANLKNALILNHVAQTDKTVVKVYTILWNDQLFLIAPVNTQTQQVTQLRKIKVAGCGPWTNVKDFSIMMLPNLARTKAVVNQIHKDMKVDNIDEVVDLISDPLFKKVIGV